MSCKKCRWLISDHCRHPSGSRVCLGRVGEFAYKLFWAIPDYKKKKKEETPNDALERLRED